MKRFRPSLRTTIEYVSLLVFSVVYMLLFSLWTTPLYKDWYGCDASFFTMAGRGITKGWIPYRDFFDLKGPCFFFLEALGQLICPGRTGAWILQVVALFVTLCLIIKLCRLFISYKKTLFITVLFLVLHIATLWGGNTLEEFMLPLSLLVMLLILRDLSGANSIKPVSALITGICFGIILFAKVTVASPIIGITLAVIIYFIYSRRFRDLIEFLLFSLLGLLIVTSAIFIYFAVNHNLIDMLYSVFVFAFNRGTDFGEKFNLRWELKISGCYFALVYALCQVIKLPARKTHRAAGTMAGSEVVADYPETANSSSEVIADCPEAANNGSESPDISGFILISVACIAFVTAVALHFGTPFIYYFTTVYPTLILTFIAMFMKYDPFTLFKTWRLDVPLIVFAVMLCYFASHTASTLNTVIYGRDNCYYRDYVNDAREMASLIPASDRNSVYSINMDMQWFEINEILPCYSYTINLQFFVDLDPRIQDKIINRLDTDPPKWIVVGGDLAGYLPLLNDSVVTKYSNIYDNSYGALYRLND